MNEPMKAPSQVRFCPDCGSASVDFGELVGGPAVCRACGWRGVSDDLFVHLIEQPFADNSEIVREMMSDIRRLYSSELALAHLKFLLKWGFLDGDIERAAATIDRRRFSRYLSAIARASLIALVQERQTIEQERVRGEVSHGS